MENDLLNAPDITINSSRIISGIKAGLIKTRINIRILKLAIEVYKNPVKAYKILRQLIIRIDKVQGKIKNLRYVESDNKYYWSVDYPAWPSPTFDMYIKNEFNRIGSNEKVHKSLQTIIFAITNRCSLQCKHCFEWDKLDNVDKLSLEELKTVLNKILAQGIRHIQLSGGEPLVRFDDMIELIKSADSETNFWILTSGFGLTSEKAATLKKAGLTGVNISLDHWNHTFHNDFRNNNNSFKWVKDAVKNCKENGIIVSLSLCATKEFISIDNLTKYLELAKEWKVDFIRILEPRNVGRFINNDAEIDSAQQKILEEFYIYINSDKKYREYPLLNYPGYHQRKVGCFGAGNRYLYIDSNADFHACPFCLQKQGNALTDSFNDAILKMKEKKCHAFKMNYND